ncbi:hypothetical protein H4582DRAFT_400789 [Lactarius indigo]|nr:hypothetical protein H4582DRAFT_400789 [Lactarius indigo]
MTSMCFSFHHTALPFAALLSIWFVPVASSQLYTPQCSSHNNPFARVSTLSSRYCTTILSALQLYIMTCRRPRPTLALQQLSSSTTTSHTSPLVHVHVSYLYRKTPKKQKVIHDKTRLLYLTPAAQISRPRRLILNPPEKADRHHPSLFRAFFSISEDVSPFAPHLSPLTPSLVTLARQRGYSRISVHVNVKWSDVLFFPHRDRTIRLLRAFV